LDERSTLRAPWWDKFREAHLASQDNREPTWEDVKKGFLQAVGVDLVDKEREARTKLLGPNRLHMRGTLANYCFPSCCD
jgi:hypothetical protein